MRIDQEGLKNGGSNYDSLDAVGVTMSQVNYARLAGERT
jgi:hypothetical protein